MSFRSELRSILGEAYSSELSDKIVTLHRQTVDPMKDEIDELKAKAAKAEDGEKKLAAIQKELDDLKAGDFEAKWKKERAEFTAYKDKIAADAETTSKKAAYRKAAQEAGIADKYLDAVVKAADLGAFKLDKDGNAENADELKAAILKDWPEFKATNRERGPKVDTPPKPEPGGAPVGSIRELTNKWHAERYGSAEPPK